MLHKCFGVLFRQRKFMVVLKETPEFCKAKFRFQENFFISFLLLTGPAGF